MEKVRIQVDDRERNEVLLEALRAFDDLSVTVTRLETGDFLVGGEVMFERKTAIDFAQSLVDGRLFTQVARLSLSPYRTAMILEGDPEDGDGHGVPRHAVQGALISLMLIFDIPTLRSADPEETACLIRYAGMQLLRARSDGQIKHRKVPAKRRSTQRRRILQALPAIGPDRARRLLEHFGNVRACLNADESSLLEVEGIGPATAKRIVNIVCRDESCGM